MKKLEDCKKKLLHKRDDQQLQLPKSSDFPEGTHFVIKEFDVPLAQIPDRGWFNWFGGVPRPFDASVLRVDNNWAAGSFEEWVGVIRASLKGK